MLRSKALEGTARRMKREERRQEIGKRTRERSDIAYYSSRGRALRRKLRKEA